MAETCPTCHSEARNWYLKGCKPKKHDAWHDVPLTAPPTFADDTTAMLWCAGLRITATVEGLGEGTEPMYITFTEEDEMLIASFQTGRFWDAATKYARVRQVYLRSAEG
jgi:hypothetical protein